MPPRDPYSTTPEPRTADQEIMRPKPRPPVGMGGEFLDVESIPQPPASTDFDALVQAITMTESKFDLNAKSEKGAVGLMQIKPSSWTKSSYGAPSIFEFVKKEFPEFEVQKEDENTARALLLDPEVNVAYGKKLIKSLSTWYGSLEDGLRAYNMGAPEYTEWKEKGSDPARLPEQTFNYVPKIKARYEQYVQSVNRDGRDPLTFENVMLSQGPRPTPRPDNLADGGIGTLSNTAKNMFQEAVEPFDPEKHDPIQTAGQSTATEYTSTTESPDGDVWNIPQIWFSVETGEPALKTGDDAWAAAYEYEKQTGKMFPRFNSIPEAESAAQSRSDQGGASEQPLARMDGGPVYGIGSLNQTARNMFR